MAVTFIKRSSIPMSVKGKVATEPTVVITEKGQLSLNSLSSKFLNGNPNVVIGFDSGKVLIFKPDAKLVAKVPESEYFVLGKSKKNPNYFMTATNLLKSTEVFGEHIYDYAKSGNQTFPAVLDEKNGCIRFELPKGALTPKPKVARAPRKKAASAVKAEVGSTEAITAASPSTGEPELVLE